MYQKTFQKINHSQKSIVLFLFVFGMLFSRCDFVFDANSIEGNGNVVEMERTVDSFHGIRVSNGLDVYLSQDELKPLLLVLDENLHDVVKTNVINGVLVIESEMNIRHAKEKSIYISMPKLDRIKISSAGDVRGETPFKVNDIDIDLSSAGDLRLEISASNVSVNISSAGSAILSGEAESLDADLSSAGDLKAFNLITNHVKVRASSSGDADVYANESFDLSASSAGDIRYRGPGMVKSSHTSSAGNIKRVD